MPRALMRRRIFVTGIVQGVGFRPFTYGLAARLGLSGWVRNTSAGVEIEVEGPADAVQHFVDALPREAPPLAHLDRVDVLDIPPLLASPPRGDSTFEIQRSLTQAGAVQPVSPDVTTCPDCRAEVFDPTDRRYRYPFTNCTNCGPRFTIILDLPYDRPQTTMAPFRMCPQCQREYDDPADRRFHAQPNACPDCGPHVWLEADGKIVAERDAALAEARRLIAAGSIIALKGLGGFHLACDATSNQAVAELRRRKGRVDKPFAVMARDAATVAHFCQVSEAEADLLASSERPIVLLARRPEPSISEPTGPGISDQTAPGNDHLGFMLPYTPLHLLLLEPADGYPAALVMTSGNFAEQPIVIDNDTARRALPDLADALLLHDRRIHARCDDSVVRVFRGRDCPIRRARSYAPFPVPLPFEAPHLLACGGELKNTFCVTRSGYAFLSQHIGDLENYETLASFETTIEHFKDLFRVQPQAVAHDLHPDYLATRYALGPRTAGLTRIGVQHHHAHIAACMAEHGLPLAAQVIGLSFDGTGFGTDGTIWGGEVLVGGYRDYRRAAHLAPIVLPGGEAAIRGPYRMALAWLRAADVDWATDLPPVAAASAADLRVVEAQLDGRLPGPITSSMGRLFDAMSSLAGVRQRVGYEAQAAIEFETVLDPGEDGAYDFELTTRGDALVMDPAPAVRAAAADVRAGRPAGMISARFHNAVADVALATCRRIRQAEGIDQVCLSGGVFQNLSLLERLLRRLEGQGFRVYWHEQVPPNDGGLALGQVVVAAAQLLERT